MERIMLRKDGEVGRSGGGVMTSVSNGSGM